MPPNMNHPPNLLSLPNELLAEICAQTEGSEWPEISTHPLEFLRLTCKHLYVPATKELAKRFFTKPCVMVNTYSLQALVDICAHPIIGPYVHGVTLDAFRLGPDTYRQIQDKLKTSITNGDIKSMKQQENELQGFWEALEEDAILDDGGLAVNLLTKALRCIKARHGAVFLAVTSMNSPIGGGKGLGKLPNDRNTTWQNEDTMLRPMSALRMLVDAAKHSGCQVIDFMFQVTADEIVELESNISIAIAKAGDVFAGLKSLCIELESVCAERITTDLARILPLAKSISSLELSTTIYMNGDCIAFASKTSKHIGKLLHPISSDALRQVKLAMLVCEQEDVRRFLERHKSTIKELSFLDVVIIGAWDELLEWIGVNMHLEKFEIETRGTLDALDANDDSNINPLTFGSIHEVLQGEEQVRLGLGEIVQKKRSADGKRLHDEEAGETEETEEIEEVEEVEDETPV
ncbi:hypothetical protein D6C85_08685 [Aureobasidium pullulans]|uniref:Uncharacterized protein n=1 Tax=Aureobasidium pullulans TaxID=5580 RepID=A0A4S9YCG3_AURPU|nr:hypothetical protein D6D20_10263 [Aureobasidium pullulans]THZ64324.1 hypothetical protein D6C85_08685 [Aureobasidium pullulans]THZ90978.1 hypothetical protein D6C82_10178 [Aureobasidium pullulans]